MGKKNSIFYYKGRNISGAGGNRDIPIEAVPNTNIDVYSEKGVFHRRRKFDGKGSVLKDMDRGYPGTDHPDDHVHDWVGKRRSASPRKGKDLTKPEQKEFKKAKKKRWWKK